MLFKMFMMYFSGYKIHLANKFGRDRKVLAWMVPRLVNQVFVQQSSKDAAAGRH